MSDVKLLIGMTGSIGMLSMPVHLQCFLSAFPQLKVIMTDAAKEFIPEETISLIVPQVYSTLFPFSPQNREGFHVRLAQWADIFIVIPASANILAEVAHGMSRSLLTTTILCHQKPVLFFPNMNGGMWSNPATQRNVALLEKYGHKVISPMRKVGYVYSTGTINEGQFMPGAEEALAIIQDEVRQRSSEPLNVG